MNSFVVWLRGEYFIPSTVSSFILINCGSFLNDTCHNLIASRSDVLVLGPNNAYIPKILLIFAEVSLLSEF